VAICFPDLIRHQAQAVANVGKAFANQDAAERFERLLANLTERPAINHQAAIAMSIAGRARADQPPWALDANFSQSLDSALRLGGLDP